MKRWLFFFVAFVPAMCAVVVSGSNPANKKLPQSLWGMHVMPPTGNGYGPAAE
jgi:hypothetical protein